MQHVINGEPWKDTDWVYKAHKTGELGMLLRNWSMYFGGTSHEESGFPVEMEAHKSGHLNIVF